MTKFTIQAEYLTLKPMIHFLNAIRPKTLIAVAMPITMATCLAARQGDIQTHILVIIAIAGTLIQIGTNLANDYYDAQKGADTPNRIGPTRVTASGLIKAGYVKAAFLTCFGLSFLFGLILVAHGGWPILLIGLVSIFLGYAYTGGPYPLAYHGWGDFFAGLFFGPVAVSTTHYLLTLRFDTQTLLIGLIPAGISVGLITINNLRDQPEDATTGKRTLVVRFGRLFGLTELTVANTTATLLLASAVHTLLPSFHAIWIVLIGGLGMGITLLAIRWPIQNYNRLLGLESAWGLIVATCFCYACMSGT